MASNLPVCLCRAPFGEDHAADCPHRPRADGAQKPALDTISAIRRLHHPREGRRTVENGVKCDPPKVVVFCDHCEFMEYPCATIRLLDAYGAP